MKLNKWKTPLLVVGWFVVIVLTILLFYKPARFWGSMIMEISKDRQRLVRLLSETNHQALLEACREISKEVSEGNLAPNRYSVRYKPDPEVSRFPQLVLDIEPLYIDVSSDGCVELEIFGALHHCGITAYPENYTKPNEHFKYGDKKIIDGLWYYEHGYSSQRGKWIDSLLKKENKRGKIEICVTVGCAKFILHTRKK
jgi:hypothetical protein